MTPLSPRHEVSARRARRLAAADPEAVWDLFGSRLWALACVVVGEEPVAASAVALAMGDLFSPAGAAQHQAAHTLLPAAARAVHARARELGGHEGHDRAPGDPALPPLMTWTARLADLQRSVLALCCFGGHSYRMAAEVLAVPPATVAALLTSALMELERPAEGTMPPSGTS